MSTVDVEVTIQRRGHRATNAIAPELTRIPRITRLMALAIKFQDMVDRREVRDYAEIARLGYVTRARMTQIMNLLLLPPDVQEAILFPTDTSTQSLISERNIRRIVCALSWDAQRELWRKHTSR